MMRSFSSLCYALLFVCSLAIAEDGSSSKHDLTCGNVRIVKNIAKSQFYWGSACKFILSDDEILKFLSSEFGQEYINGVERVESANFVVEISGETWKPELGKIEVFFSEEDKVLNLFHAASKRKNFQSKKILTIYSVKRGKKSVTIFYRQGILSIMSIMQKCEKEDIECQVVSIIEVQQKKTDR